MMLPEWTSKGFCKPLYASVTNTVNWHIGQATKAKLTPVAILLGPTASIAFAYEHWGMKTSQGPKQYGGLPIYYNVFKLSGVALAVKGKAK